jgi:GAF domain-containing protein
MASFSVSARGLASVQVQGANWIQALGCGLEQLGRAAEVARLACEVLPNGTVIARDITSGTGYIVQQVQVEETVAEPVEFEELEILPEDAISEIEPEPDPLDAIDRADTVKSACEETLRLARVSVFAESGAIILEDRGYLRFHAVEGPHARKLAGIRLPMGTGVAGFAMERRRTVVLADAHEDPRHCGEVDALTGYVTKEIAVVPIICEDHVFGVLELMNLRGGGRFGQDHVDTLREIADALARRLIR